MITYWNKQGVNPHLGLGEKTKERIRRVIEDALQDFSEHDLLDTIAIYSRLYKSRRCDHKYRLVEFLEKRGCEHFTNEANWTSGDKDDPRTSEDFTYTQTNQDRSMFGLLDDDDQKPD